MRLHRTTRTTALAAVALAGLLGLAACGDSSTTASGSGGSSSSTVPADAPYNAQDVAFASGMKPHHEQAVEMADTILSKDPSPQVQALATQIKAAQQPEIAQLDALLAEFDAEADGAGAHGGGHGGGHDASGGAGMMSAEDVQALEEATGAEAERLFLEGMLAHHRGAVEMATEEVAGGEHPDAIELATTIKADQQAEIAQMEQLLEQA